MEEVHPLHVQSSPLYLLIGWTALHITLLLEDILMPICTFSLPINSADNSDDNSDDWSLKHLYDDMESRDGS